MNTEMLESTVDTETVDAEVTTEVDLAAFDDGWDDDSAPVATEKVEAEQETEETSEADQHEEVESGAEQQEEAADQSGEEEAETEPAKDANQLLSVKHLDTIRELDWNKDRDEIKTLVQKGMDYDRKTSKLSDYEDFLKELAAPQKLTIEQLMDTTRARLFKVSEAKEGREISDTDALLAVQKQRADKASAKQTEVEAQQRTERETADQKNRDMLNRFIAAYPDVKGDAIPKSVWEESQKSGDLVAAYAKYEKKQLEQQIAALKLNKKNSERSIGSVRSTGATKTRDAFDEGWDDID